MAVCSADQHRLAIHFEQAVADFYLTEPDVAGFSFDYLTVWRKQGNHRAVKRRLFSTP